MGRPECSICDNIFDSSDHRPRALPCGHGFCSMCINAAILRGDKTCAICRREHGANSSTDLPVSFLLEDYAHKSIVSASQNPTSDLVQQSNYGMCPKHKEIPLYFLCKSHNIKVCHSCAVIDHPPTSCQLTSFEEEIKERKNIQRKAFKKQNQAIINMNNELNILLHQNIGENNLLVTKVKQLSQEIGRKRKSIEKIQGAIKVCKQKQKDFIVFDNSLSAATSNEDIAIQCEQVNTKVLQSQEWEEKLKKELNIEQLHAKVEWRGVVRSSKVFEENGKVFIPSLSRDVKPPASAKLMKEDEFDLDASTITVFLDIAEKGNIIGRVFICVLNNTSHGQYFIKKVHGFNGCSIKGANICYRDYSYVQLDYCKAENGSEEYFSFEMLYEDTKPRRPLRGMLFPSGSSFVIRTKDGGWAENAKWDSHFATIVSGMNVIDILASKQLGVTDIIISDCGIVLNS